VDYILTPVGQMTNNSGTFTPQFNITDHLGNVRSVVNSSGAVLQSTDYYPFGLAFADNNVTTNRYLFNGKELENYTLGTTYLGTLDYGARHYDPRIARWTVPDPMAEKYYGISGYVYCANNPMRLVDPDGRFPVWAVVGAVVDYGFQVYYNYKSGKSGYDAWVGDVDFLDVGLSAVNPTGKFKVAKTLLVEGIKAVVNITENERVKVNTNVEEVVTNTLVNTVVDVGVGKVTDAGSKKAVQNANKEVSIANQKLKTAERQAQRSPNSTKKAENVNNAQSNLQSARNKQVLTKMLNSTVGKSPNATQQVANILTNRALKDEEENKR
jgi:RHS repeat-associated protein